MPWRATQDGQVMVESYDKMLSTGEGNGKSLCHGFVDWDLGTGVDEKDAGDPSLEWNKGALFAEMHVYISSYKAALGSKKIEQKQSQANNNFQRARKHSISWVRGA